jgi:heat shock protein HslJ
MEARRKRLAVLVLTASFALSCAASASPPATTPPAGVPPAPAVAPSSPPVTTQTDALTGTAWTVTAYNNGKQAVVSVLPGTKIDAAFGADGQVTGRAGCNRYFATYRIEGGALAIGQAGATRMFCGEPAGLMEQEQQFLTALQSAAAFEVEGDVLTLRSAGGETAVTLDRRAH